MEELMQKMMAELIEYAAGDDAPNTDTQMFLETLAKDALSEVRATMFPHGFANDAEMQQQELQAMKRYFTVIKRIAEYHFDKQGKEGVLGTTEGGTYNYYENAGTPKSYLRPVMPVCMFV